MQWSSELYHYEASPPPGSWDRINFELDNNISGLRSNLKDFQETPPPAVWTAVKNELDGFADSSILPWYSRPSRWIAAASVAAILVIAAWLLSGQKQSFLPADVATSILPHESAALASPKTIPTDPDVLPPSSSNEQKSVVGTFNPENPLKKSPMEDISVISYPNAKTYRAGRYASLAVIDMNTRPGEVKAPLTIRDKRDYRMVKAVQFHDGNYIHIVSPEGNTVRLSYKLQELIPAIHNDVDNVKLREWKSKLQSSAVIPANVNFFDIADMVGLMTDK